MFASPVPSPSQFFQCVKFHPNCSYIATGSSDRCVRLWDINSGHSVRLFTGHTAPVYAVAFSPNGRLLASASEDGQIFVWDLAAGKRIAALTKHTSVVWALDFSAESTLLVSGSQDGSVRVWSVERMQKAAEGADAGSFLISTCVAPLLPLSFRSYPTKKTPVFTVAFTKANLVLAAGRFDRRSAVGDDGVPMEILTDERVKQ
jgi:transcription initiation factor TFIID subunit 5